MLVVDDIDMNRLVLQSMLEEFGVQSDEAMDGAECLRKIKEKSFNECCSSYKGIFLD